MRTQNESDAVMALAAKILRAEGQLRYFKDWDAEISARLSARKADPIKDPVTFQAQIGGSTLHYRKVVPRTIKAGKTRRFRYAELRKTYPDLYSEFVIETDPKYPVAVTFRAERRGKKSAAWEQLRSAGWCAMDAEYHAKRNLDPIVEYDSTGFQLPTGHYGIREQARFLDQIRRTSTVLKPRMEGWRLELCGLMVPEPGVSDLEDFTYSDGVIDPSLRAKSRSIDLDAAQDHPTLSRFITVTTRPETTVWKIEDVLEDDEDGEQDAQ